MLGACRGPRRRSSASTRRTSQVNRRCLRSGWSSAGCRAAPAVRAQVCGPCEGMAVSMRWLRSSSEAEMVALFSRTELPSDRWKDDLRALLGRAGLPGRVITAPDLGDDAENQERLR